MSDDEVLALDKETRGQPHGPPLIGAAAPKNSMSKLGRVRL